jgi:hypothetical protein
MPQLQAHGLTVQTPKGWEGRIFRRAQQGELGAQAEVPGPPAPPGGQTYPVLHVATIPLAPTVADFASDAVEALGPTDALVVLKEYAPTEATKPLFASPGLPTSIDPDAFNPSVLNRLIAGQAGLQRFLNANNRAFCLYIVLGGYQRRHDVVPGVNTVLSSVRIDPGTGPTSVPSTPTTAPPP